MKELQPNIIDDLDHRVHLLIQNHGDAPGFPKMEAEGISQEKLDEFLFNYQSILDSQGTLRTQLTIYGIIALIPVFIASAFPEESLPMGNNFFFIALAMGVVLALLIRSIATLIRQMKLTKLKRENPVMAQYVDDVCAYGDSIKKTQQH